MFTFAAVFLLLFLFLFFFFNDTATTEIYTLSLHDALPISRSRRGSAGTRSSLRVRAGGANPFGRARTVRRTFRQGRDRKSTRLNSSHGYISYAVFCLKKKKNTQCRLYATRKRAVCRCIYYR